MKRYFLSLILIVATVLLIPESTSAAVHLGLPSAVKSTVKKLSSKIQAKKASYKLAANTVVLSQQTNAYLISADTTTHTYNYSPQAGEIAALSPGKVIISTQGNGFLRKVVSVTHIGSGYKVETTTAPLNEAFDMLDIEFHQSVTPSNAGIQPLSRPQGVVTAEKFNLGKNTVLYDADGDYNTTNDQITSDLSFLLGISIDAKIDMPDPQHLRSFYLKVNTEKDIGFGLSASVGASVHKEFPIVPEIIIPIWTVPPVTLNIDSNFIVALSISGGADIHTSGKEMSYTGVICDNDCYASSNWRVESSSSSSFNVDSVSGNAELSLQMGPDLEISAKLCDFIGPFFDLSAYAKDTVDTPLNHLPYTVAVGVEARGGVKAEMDTWFGSLTFFSIDTSLIKYEYVFGQGSLLNQTPVISAVAANPHTVDSGVVSTLECTASDADSDTLAYSWSVAAGTITGSGSQVTWTAPTAPSTYTVTCGVLDGWGGSVQKSTTVVVSAISLNHTPVISSLTANPASVSTGTATTITCAASDANADTLTYNWSAVSGTISGTGAQITWIAPEIVDGYTIACTVTDGQGGSAQQSVNVNVANSGVSNGHELPDTGQTVCYDGSGSVITCPAPGNALAQDGSYQPAASQPAYIDNGDGTTTDNKTGLMWVKDGASAGCNNGSALTWEAALNFCEGLTYAGYSDWRLPNVRELESLVDSGQSSPAINTAYFSNTQSNWYWTSTTYVPIISYAWTVYSYRGDVDRDDKSSSNGVRCVRAGP